MNPPGGDVRPVWTPNAKRADIDRDYVDACLAFLRQHVRGACDGQVFIDDTGTRVLVATTLLDDDGNFHVDSAGRRAERTVVVELDPDEVLP